MRIWRILNFIQIIIIYLLQSANYFPTKRDKTMPHLILAIRGAHLGPLPNFFTNKEREHLQLFQKIFNINITKADTKIILIIKSYSIKDWAPTHYHIIELIQ